MMTPDILNVDDISRIVAKKLAAHVRMFVEHTMRECDLMKVNDSTEIPCLYPEHTRADKAHRYINTLIHM